MGFTDNFDRTNAQPLGNGWADGPSASWYVDNASGTAGTAYDLSGGTGRWTEQAGTAPTSPDVDVSLTVTASPATGGGVVVRKSGGNFVVARFDTNSVKFMRWASNAYAADLANAAGLTFAAGDVVRCTAVGTTYKIYQNGVLRLTAAYSNASYDGNTGVGMYSEGGSLRVDNFSWSAVANLSASRANVLCGAGTTSVPLTGSGTAYTAGTPGSPAFSLVNPPAGWSVASQVVNSASSATLTLNRGTGAGPVTVSDGTLTCTLTATNTATAVAAGNWSSGSTWDVAVAPGPGNLAAVPTGLTVTVDSNLTVGSSPSDTTTNALTCAGTGGVTVADGVTFTVRGNVSVDNGVLQVGTGSTGGAVLEFDAGAAGTPATSYQCAVGGNGKTSARFRVRGTAANRAVVRSNAGGGNARVTVTDGLYDVQDASLVRVGDATRDGLTFAVVSASSGTHALARVSIDAGSGRAFTSGTLPPGVGLSLSAVLSAAPGGARFTGAAPGAGVTRSVDLCSFAGPLFWSETGFKVTRSVLDNEGGGAAGAGAWASDGFAGNFLRLTSTSGGGLSGFPLRGDVTDLYVLADGGTDNPHILIPRDTGSPQTLDGAVVEYTSTILTDGGNWFYGAGTWTLVRCIQLPTVNAGATGAVGAISPGSGCVWKVVHCTLHSPHYNGGILIGDVSAAAGELPEVRDNIFWAPQGVSATAVTAVGTAVSSVTDCVTPAGCHHNALINVNATAYEGTYTLGTPGANDVRITAASLPFVDVNRNLATWAASVGSAGATYAARVADGRAYLRADPTLVPLLMAYVRGGQVPTDGRLRNAGSDGVTMGAFDLPPPYRGHITLTGVG